MKKFAILGTAIALIMLTSCKEQREGDVTKVPEKTTSLTLTVSLTETVPTPEPVPQDIELAVYNPFANAVKVDNTVKNELLGFAEKLETARQLLQADWRIHDSEEYTDKENVVEVIEDFQYKPFINKDIAQNEDELTKYMRNFFTENYLSDKDIREQLFSDKNTLFGFPPYKTVDGQLCIRCGYDGVMTNISTDDIWVMSYNGNYAEVVMYAYSAANPPPHAFIGFERSDEYGWRLDSLEFKEYNETFVRIYKTAAEKYDTLNKILGGGEVPENAAEFTDNGIRYVQTELDMSIDEMRQFFTDTFRHMTETIDGRRTKLLVPYTEKYIDSVFLERDGVLYRAADAPKWYIPEDEFDPYNMPISAKQSICYGCYVVEENFYDKAADEHFTHDIAVYYDFIQSDNENAEVEYTYYGLYFASELPIKELE